MPHKQIDFHKLNPEAQEAFLNLVRLDQQQQHAKSVLGKPDMTTASTWFIWTGLCVVMTIISTQFVSDEEQLAREVVITLGTAPPPATTSLATMALGILSVILLLIGLIKHFRQQQGSSPSWPPRIYFTDRLMIDANTETLVLIPLQEIQSVTLEQCTIGQYGTNVFFFTSLQLNAPHQVKYTLESGQQDRRDKALEQAVCNKVTALIQNPISEDVYTIDGVSLLD